ncbi:MAG: fibronectin type III domain-containing protein, partial [Saccharothrix sp.]|nr:fibronectin type III domain-containing protein [Saccharothrix sp.]
ASLGVLLLVGAALGNGIARTAVDVSDGLTWLGDDERGEVVQVNPSSGKPQTRLQVSGGDAQLEVAQSDDKLIVLDRRTGQITVIDLATLLASGRRQAPVGQSPKVLIVDDRIYVVDRDAGTVHNVDPVTLADLGEPWRVGRPLADVVSDDRGVVWAVDHGGNLHALEWAEETEKFRELSNRPVPGAGPRTALVPHERGVTLLGLEGGVVVRDGTARDLTASTDSLSGDVLAAQTSPPGLVPASVPDAAAVVLVTDDNVRRVDMNQYGCARPGRPAVFRERVYVPCHGAGKVVVLDRDGKRGSQDVPAPGKDPELVFDDGKLFINTPGASNGVIVDTDGRTKDVVIRSPELPVTDPDRSPIPSVPSPPPPRPDPPTRDDRRGGGADPTTTTEAPVVTTTPSAGVKGVAPGRPPGVTVNQVSNDGSTVVVRVTWGAAPDNGEAVSGYSVTATGGFSGGSKTAQVAGTSTELSLSCAGGTFCASGRLDVSVVAYNRLGAGEASSANFAVRPPAVAPSTTTTTKPPQPEPQPEPTTTTTQPPAPQPTTTTTPPPPSMPTAGVVVISAVGLSGDTFSRVVNTSPPADWANFSGTCEVVNTTYDYSVPIPCSGGSVEIYVDYGSNRLVVRASAGGQSVDSYPRSVAVRDPETEPCSGGRICQPRSAPSAAPMAGGGIALLAAAWLLGLRNRRRPDDEDPGNGH